MLKVALLSKLATLKVAAAAAVATTAVGGVALAATGTLPTPFGAANASNAASAHPTGNAGERGGAHGSPSPSLVGLCRAYNAGATDNDGQAIDNPAFSALVSAAGGEDNVTSYCEQLLATAPGASNAPEHPTGKPSTTGAPASLPSRAPTERPAGPPSPPPSTR